ncbi:MAG: APC family permease [Eubacteriales bacterium]|nr:APC family permease [Eubacteriales bacterium]
MSENQQSQQLKKGFKTIDVLMLAFGTMIGWGWIMLSGKWGVDAGIAGAVVAYLMGAVLCIFVGLAYAELTPAIPYTGGGVVFAYKSMGYWPAVIAGLGTCLAYIGVAAWEGPAFATAVDYVFPLPDSGYLWTIQGFDVYLPWSLVAIAMSVILIFVNYVGARQTAIFQTLAAVGLIAVGVLLVGGATVNGNFANAQPLFTDFKGLSMVLLMVPAMFVGFDVIPQSASEMDVPLKKIPKLLIASIFMATAWYVIMIISTGLAAPLDIRTNMDSIPVADAMAYAFGSPIGGKICIIGAILGIVTSWNGFLYGGARVLFSMGKARMFPAFFGKIHPKYGTPANAVLFVGVISTFSCLLGKGALVWLVDASSLGVVVTYTMVTLSFIYLRKNFPDLERPYAIKPFKFVAFMCVLVCLFFLWLYTPFGPAPLLPIEWIFVVGWFVLGGALAIYAKAKYASFTNADREAALFTKED